MGGIFKGGLIGESLLSGFDGVADHLRAFSDAFGVVNTGRVVEAAALHVQD